MMWSPKGVAISVESRAAFSLSDVEESDFARCPVRVGATARRGTAHGQPRQQPFGETLIAATHDVVEALAAGRVGDPDGGLSRAAATYATQHPAVRMFLDAVSLNYLEFLEAREASVGALIYDGYSLSRPVGADVSVKLWAPVYRTEDGNREVHRLRYGAAKSDLTAWAHGAAWITSADRSRVSVVEVGLTDVSEVVLYASETPEAIERTHNEITLPLLRTAYTGDRPVPGADCTRCVAVSVCPEPIPMNIFQGLPDRTAWVRSLSASDLATYKSCPAKAFIKSQHLPRAGVLSEAAERGLRIHRLIAEAHASSVGCRDALSPPDFDPDDAPYLEAHIDLCDRSGRPTVALEQTLVGWDRHVGDVIYMKPDEVQMRDDGVLVLREIKTTTKATGLDPVLAWDQFADVMTWWFAVLRGGLLQHYGATVASIELEVLTPEGGAIHTIALDDPEVDLRIAGWLMYGPALWLGDTEHLPNPGPQCVECNVIRWCKEGQAHS